MPGNERFLLRMSSPSGRYVEMRGRKVFVEYVMLGGVNDRVEQAQHLADRLRAARSR